MIDILKTIIQTCLRLFPFPTEPGLRSFGNPDRSSPVFVTCNFDLTVRRVSKRLKNLNCYLLVANTKGINVWCAAGGGKFTEKEVVSVIRTSGIRELVDHRELILPQFSAPGIDIREIKEKTGWESKFGPAYAEDIPAYVKNGFIKAKKMCLAQFPLSERLEMAVMWAFGLSALLFLPLIIFWQSSFFKVLALVWAVAIAMFSLCFILPGKTGIAKALSLGILSVLAFSLYFSLLGDGNVVQIITWGLGSVLVSLIVGSDFAGSSPLYAGEFVEIGRKFKFLRKFEWFQSEGRFRLEVDQAVCIGCGTCTQVCPRGVHELDVGLKKSKLMAPELCEFCTACVKQCPAQAIWTVPSFVAGRCQCPACKLEKMLFEGKKRQR